MTDTVVAELIKERRKTHGDFSEVARVAQAFRRVAMDTTNWDGLSDVQREGLEMVMHKLARILCGDDRFLDHWDDAEGYIRCVREAMHNERVEGVDD